MGVGVGLGVCAGAGVGSCLGLGVGAGVGLGLVASTRGAARGKGGCGKGTAARTTAARAHPNKTVRGADVHGALPCFAKQRYGCRFGSLWRRLLSKHRGWPGMHQKGTNLRCGYGCGCAWGAGAVVIISAARGHRGGRGATGHRGGHMLELFRGEGWGLPLVLVTPQTVLGPMALHGSACGTKRARQAPRKAKPQKQGSVHIPFSTPILSID